MKHIVFFIFAFILPLLSTAQDERVVNGFVYGENGGPVIGAVVSPVGANIFTRTDTDGKFVIRIPQSVEELKVESPGYHSLTLTIDEPFMVFRLKLDKGYASRVYEYASIEAKLASDNEKKIIEKRTAGIRSARYAEKRKIDSLYNQKFRNIGLVHSIELFYGYQLGHGDVVYKNLGYRDYGNLHPVEVNYTLGYRFNNFCSFGVGTGLQYQLVNLCDYPDVFDPSYSGKESYTALNIPIFLNSKIYMSRGRFQPLFSLSGGVYAPSLKGLLDVGLGLNIRMNRTANFYFIFSCRTTPYADFREYTPGIYDSGRNFSAYYTDVAWTPSFKIGCTF